MNRLPHNPGVRELVANKRRYSHQQTVDEAQLGFRGWHERGYLPHFDAPNRVQFVTFRLSDCFPEGRRPEWAHFANIENDEERRTQLEEYLDRGHGEAWLKQPAIGAVVEGALLFFDGERYELRAWVVMPNHVHVLFKVGTVPTSEIIESWKSFTAKEANKLLGRRGNFWQGDYWDTFMRDAEHDARTVRYIEDNPPKAKLVLDPVEWPWSSARLRNEHGCLPQRSAPVPGAAATLQERAADNPNHSLPKDALRPGVPRSAQRPPASFPASRASNPRLLKTHN